MKYNIMQLYIVIVYCLFPSFHCIDMKTVSKATQHTNILDARVSCFGFIWSLKIIRNYWSISPWINNIQYLIRLILLGQIIFDLVKKYLFKHWFSLHCCQSKEFPCGLKRLCFKQNTQIVVMTNKGQLGSQHISGVEQFTDFFLISYPKEK